MRRAADLGATDVTPLVGTGADAGASMLVIAGAGTFSTHSLDRRELVIGRAADCDVRVDHKALSRRHALLRVGPRFSVQDLGSTNGTQVAGQLLRGGDPVELAPGSAFLIGPFSFVLVTAASADERSLSARDGLRILDPTAAGVPALVRDIAASPASVVILGETGVGKEVLAETLHALSGRPGPLTRINCAALSETLLESELFGHEKGAFTGAGAQRAGLLEAADRGTIFLDEVGELPLSIQAKLLRAIEHREVLRLGATRPIRIDVRFVAATNRDLPAEVAAGRFRRDLYFRLDGVTMVIPPLRERRSLIAPLALGFFDEARGRTGSSARIGADVLAALQAYSWPGNVRELRAVIERAVLLARAGDLGVRHLSFARDGGAQPPPPPPVAPTSSPPAPRPSPVHGAGGPHDLDDDQRADRARVLAALEECAFNQTRAARKLGIARTTLVTKLRLYRIPRPRS